MAAKTSKVILGVLGPLIAIGVLVAMYLLRSRPAETVQEPAQAAAPSAPKAVVDAWRTNAANLSWYPPTGHTESFTCPPGGAATKLHGSGPYTNDSSVCTAAVHAGLITFERGGSVTVLYTGPQHVFGSSTRHGVTSRLYPSWDDSFLFRSTDGQTIPASPADGIPIDWEARRLLGGAPAGTKLTLWCPPNGTPQSLWGTDVYSEYSNPCSAAAHAGAITVERGGTFTVEMRPGQESKGSTRNGITSKDDVAYPLSFVVIASTSP